MNRRGILGAVAALAVAVFAGIRVEATDTKARTGRAGCGPECQCPNCSCDTAARAANGCTCCGEATCCTAAEKGCCAREVAAAPLAKAVRAGCGDDGSCPACSCGAETAAKGCPCCGGEAGCSAVGP